jgi:hypothetical protein
MYKFSIVFGLALFITNTSLAYTFGSQEKACRPRAFEKGDQIINAYGGPLLTIDRIDTQRNNQLITDEGTFNSQDYCLYIESDEIVNESYFGHEPTVIQEGELRVAHDYIRDMTLVGKIKDVSTNNFVKISTRYYPTNYTSEAESLENFRGYSEGSCALLLGSPKSHEVSGVYMDQNGEVYILFDTAVAFKLNIIRPDPNSDCKAW